MAGQPGSLLPTGTQTSAGTGARLASSVWGSQTPGCMPLSVSPSGSHSQQLRQGEATFSVWGRRVFSQHLLKCTFLGDTLPCRGSNCIRPLKAGTLWPQRCGSGSGRGSPASTDLPWPQPPDPAVASAGAPPPPPRGLPPARPPPSGCQAPPGGWPLWPLPLATWGLPAWASWAGSFSGGTWRGTVIRQEVK